MTKRKTFLLRLDPELWDELNAWAGQELRSVNGQIEFLLREAVRQRRKLNLDSRMTEEEEPGH
ncbi:MAG: Arc family DNA binding domain-containing protein [bacterium]